MPRIQANRMVRDASGQWVRAEELTEEERAAAGIAEAQKAVEQPIPEELVEIGMIEPIQSAESASVAPLNAAAKPRRKRRAGMGGAIDDVEEGLRLTDEAKNRQIMALLWHPRVRGDKAYKPEMCDIAYNKLIDTRIVMTKRLLAGHLGISISTMYEYEKAHPELARAIAEGLAVQEAYFAAQMAGGIKYSQSLYAVLKNLHGWKEQVEQLNHISLAEAMKKQATSAKRVVWDKPVGEKPLIELQATIQPASESET